MFEKLFFSGHKCVFIAYNSVLEFNLSVEKYPSAQNLNYFHVTLMRNHDNIHLLFCIKSQFPAAWLCGTVKAVNILYTDPYGKWLLLTIHCKNIMNRYCRCFNDSTDSFPWEELKQMQSMKKNKKRYFSGNGNAINGEFEGGGGGILQYYPKSSMLIFSLSNKACHSVGLPLWLRR